ncbi:MAG: hypothetical protein KDI36_00550 [Pseudomonadales bacterium]|nr:hypothetical protein [Pseudomonadales bacterium]
MKYSVSEDDLAFKRQVESCQFPVAEFDHRAHLRLAYIYLAGNSVGVAVQLMRRTLTGLLTHVGIDPAQKYHQTLTEAWILAVYHFMKRSNGSDSADGFIDKNTVLLDSKIMLTHYSEELLFSEQARVAFVEPDLDQIPRYAA